MLSKTAQAQNHLAINPKHVYFNRLQVVVRYSTSPKSTALQWLSPEQTMGKKHPFLFSQCEVLIMMFQHTLLKFGFKALIFLGYSLSIDGPMPRYTQQQSHLQCQGNLNSDVTVYVTHKL